MNFPFMQREANRIALRMARSCGRLEQPFSQAGTEPSWMLMVSSNGYRKPVETVPAHLAKAMVSEGYLQQMEPHIYRLSSRAMALTGRHGARQQATESVDLKPSVKRKVLKGSSGKQIEVSFNASESPLDWLHKHKGRDGKPFITEAQFCAGEILRRDYTAARMGASVTFKWHYAETLAGKSKHRGAFDGLSDSEAVIAAKQRVARALKSAGSEHAGILLETCCLNNGLAAAERRLGLARRTGKTVLSAGLERLVVHYRLTS